MTEPKTETAVYHECEGWPGQPCHSTEFWPRYAARSDGKPYLFGLRCVQCRRPVTWDPQAKRWVAGD